MVGIFIDNIRWGGEGPVSQPPSHFPQVWFQFPVGFFFLCLETKKIAHLVEAAGLETVPLCLQRTQETSGHF